MDYRHILGGLQARYDAVTGGLSHRQEWYLAARFFKMTPDQWDGLGWHHQQALLDGLEDEGLIERNGSQSFDGDLTSADDGYLTGLGFHAETVELPD